MVFSFSIIAQAIASAKENVICSKIYYNEFPKKVEITPLQIQEHRL